MKRWRSLVSKRLMTGSTKALLDEGESLHRSGKHRKTVNTLAKTFDMLGVNIKRKGLATAIERMTGAENNCLSNGGARPIEFSFGAELAIHNEEHRREKPC